MQLPDRLQHSLWDADVPKPVILQQDHPGARSSQCLSGPVSPWRPAEQQGMMKTLLTAMQRTWTPYMHRSRSVPDLPSGHSIAASPMNQL